MAGTGVAFATGDSTPLLDDNGSGVYIKGRNNALDIRQGLIGSIFLADGSGITPRTGVLMGVGGTGAFKVNAQGTPNQTVLIGKGQAIVTRSGQGAYLVHMPVDQTVNMPAASAANTRYDIVCIANYDKGNFVGDAAHGPQFWVEQGTLGGGVPATPTDMLKLAEVFRAVNDNTISTEIVDRRKSTVVSGAPRQLGPGDSLADAGLLTGELRDVNGRVDRWNGTTWDQLADVQGPYGIVGETHPIDGTGVTTSETIQPETVTFQAVLNRRYKITHTRSEALGGGGPILTERCRIASGGSVTTAATQVNFYTDVPTGAYSTRSRTYFWLATGTGTFTVGFGCFTNSDSVVIDNTRTRDVVVEDIGV